MLVIHCLLDPGKDDWPLGTITDPEPDWKRNSAKQEQCVDIDLKVFVYRTVHELRRHFHDQRHISNKTKILDRDGEWNGSRHQTDCLQTRGEFTVEIFRTVSQLHKIISRTEPPAVPGAVSRSIDVSDI
jgi:hypothetical protein